MNLNKFLHNVKKILKIEVRESVKKKNLKELVKKLKKRKEKLEKANKKDSKEEISIISLQIKKGEKIIEKL